MNYHFNVSRENEMHKDGKNLIHIFLLQTMLSKIMSSISTCVFLSQYIFSPILGYCS